jgi:chromosome segregation ATPase
MQGALSEAAALPVERQAVASLSAELAAAQAQAQGEAVRSEALGEECAGLRQDIQRHRDEQQQALLQNRMEGQQQIQAQAERIVALDHECTSLRGACEAQREQNEQQTAQVQTLAAECAAAQQESEQWRLQAREAEETAGRHVQTAEALFDDQSNTLRAAASAQQRRADEAHQEALKTQQALLEMRQARDQAESCVAALQAELETGQGAAVLLEAQLGQARADTRAAEQERSFLRSQLEQACTHI